MTRVGIDVSPLAQSRAGTARYIRGLLAGLEGADLELRRYSFGGSSRVTVPLRDAGWYLTGLPRHARRDGADVLHCPTFRAPVRSSVPLVVTVHDLAVLRHPYAFNHWTRSYSRLLLPRVAAAARRIIAVSEFTKRELEALLGVPPERVRVVGHGVDETFTPKGPIADGEYVLAVSTIEPRKNLARLAEAFERAELRGLELRIAGASGWGDVRLPTGRVRMLGEVPDEKLAALYRGAQCLAYVSLYEGFGLPVVEAMASGTPVVVAQGGAPEEVAGGAAVSVDGLEPDAIAAGIAEAIERARELREAGLARAAGFGWTRAVHETIAVYEEAMR